MGINYFRREDRDYKFLLLEFLNLERLLSYEPYQDFTPEDIGMILDEVLKVGREVLGPTLQDADREGAHFVDGEVTLPASFYPAWQTMKENGWTAVSNSQAYGGQGLPAVMGGLVNEIFCGANLAVTAFMGLAVANGRVIENHGTEADRNLFLEKIYAGDWGGTMCLTEPDAGSDVGYLRTKAVPDATSDDPRIYKIEGTKRFITCGKHDLTENIIHLVLARIEGGPAGTKGISLFVVPEKWVNPDGSLGENNDVACTGIEHKMGCHGTPTCSLSFGENGNCRGILLGEPHSGMAKMFQMMNEARIGCGLQSLGLAASAYDTARQYAKERIQGPPFTNRHGDRVPIIQHEDVRRMLLNLKSGTEAMRALAVELLFLLDVAHLDPDETERHQAMARVELLTPLVKAYSSDAAYMLIRDAIQVLGGVGYCSEFPVEQYARDSKIISIWEGTTYIQSLDLVGRKLPLEGGQVFQGFLQEVGEFTASLKDDPDFGPDGKLLFKAVQATGDFAMRYMTYFRDAAKAQLIPLTSTRFLECFAEVVMAHLLLRQGVLARSKLAGVSPDSKDGLYYQGKMASASFFCRNTLTNVFGRHLALTQEDLTAVKLPEEAF
ncbi:MAG: acyl-CoA dehydrogenase [Deltaproteobacteria bacterium]|nr:acyl-CoA dehydrogenase [Deltaproteobacteria bacterium]